MNKNYASICGITEIELLDNFGPEIQNLADAQKMCPFSLLIGHSRVGNGQAECSGELRRRQPSRSLVGAAGVILLRPVIGQGL